MGNAYNHSESVSLVDRPVTIVHSVYDGISVGEQGVVECLVKQGYGVAFTKTWPCTFINEKPSFGKRVMFFEHSEVK
jgi:hypothetical protein